MEKELKQAKADLEAKSNEVKNLGGAIERYKADVNKLEQQLKEQRVSTEQPLTKLIVTLVLRKIYFTMVHKN